MCLSGKVINSAVVFIKSRYYLSCYFYRANKAVSQASIKLTLFEESVTVQY